MWEPSLPDFHAIVGAVYDFATPEPAWLEQTFRAAQTSCDGVELGLVAIARADRASVTTRRGWATSDGLFATATDVMRRQDATYIARRSSHHAATDAQLMGGTKDLVHGPILREFGVADSFCVHAVDPNGLLMALNAFTPRAAEAWPVALVDAWEAVAFHLLAAARARFAIADGTSTIEAVMTSDGTVVDACGAAVSQRELLRDAVRMIQRSRGRWRDKPDPIAARPPSIDARWTLVDQFDSDGREFIVAYAVDDRAPGAVLSPQEQRVAEHVTMGWSMKRIAYRLGLTPGAVAGYANRACRKLGVRGRVALAHAIASQPAPSLRAVVP